MKSPFFRGILIAFVFYFFVRLASAQDTAFNYQGRLTSAGAPATGTFDLRFAIYDTNGTLLGGPITNGAVGISNGLFNVTLDFGPGVFTGAGRWLEIGVRNAPGDNFTTLAPRQKISQMPYAIYAGDGSALTNVNASNIASGTLSMSRLPAGIAYTTAVTATSNVLSANRFNVKRYGAVGDGVADDSAAILTAHNLATGFGGGILYFPAGTYKCTNLLAINDTFQNPVITNYNTQISWYNIEGDGIGASTIAWSGTNSTFLSDTNAGISIRNISFVCMTAGTGGTNTGFKSWGSNGDGQVHFENVGFFNFMGAGADLQGTFGSWIHGCIFGHCGIGLSEPVYCDGMDISVGLYYCTNAGIMLGGVSQQFGTTGPNSQGVSRANRIYACGTGNNICFILGGDAPGTVVSGDFEATSNCCVAIGHPFYMGAAYIDINMTCCAAIEHLYQQAGSTPLVRLFCSPGGLLEMHNVANPFGTTVVSMTNSADNTAISADNVLLGFTEQLSTGVVITQPGIGQMLINKSLYQFQGSNQVAAINNGVISGKSLAIGGTSGPLVLSGMGTPLNVVTAPQGSLFMRTDGGANTTLYVKENGNGNTGWVAK